MLSVYGKLDPQKSEVMNSYRLALLGVVFAFDTINSPVRTGRPYDSAMNEIAPEIKAILAVHIFNKFPTLKQRKFWGSGLWSKGTFTAYWGGVS